MSRSTQIRSLIYSRLAPVFVDVPGFETTVDAEGVDVPGQVGCRLLTDGQITEARIAAYAHLADEAKDAGISLGGFLEADPEAYERERAIQMIARAFVEWPVEDPEEPKLAFPEPVLIRELDSVVVQALLEAYLSVQDTKGVQRDFRDEDLDELLERLRAPRGEGALAMLSPLGLRSVVLALARRGAPSVTDAPTKEG